MPDLDMALAELNHVRLVNDPGVDRDRFGACLTELISLAESLTGHREDFERMEKELPTHCFTDELRTVLDNKIKLVKDVNIRSEAVLQTACEAHAIEQAVVEGIRNDIAEIVIDKAAIKNKVDHIAKISAKRRRVA